MAGWVGPWSRREMVVRAGMAGLGMGVSGRLMAQGAMVPLEVACAGAAKAVMEGAVRGAVAKRLGLTVLVHAQGADAVAKALVDGSLRADVFVPITAEPMRTVIRAGMVEGAAWPVARTEMVLAYSAKGRFAQRFASAARGEAKWWEVLEEPGVRIARSDPAGDPGGRNAIFVMMLAERVYGQAGLVERVLGPTENPAQVGLADVAGKMARGEVDATLSYRSGPVANGTPFVELGREVNLSGDGVADAHPEVVLEAAGKRFRPEALVFYAGVLRGAANAEGAGRFVRWLRGSEGQGVMREGGFGGVEGVGEMRG